MNKDVVLRWIYRTAELIVAVAFLSWILVAFGAEIVATLLWHDVQEHVDAQVIRLNRASQQAVSSIEAVQKKIQTDIQRDVQSARAWLGAHPMPDDMAEIEAQICEAETVASGYFSPVACELISERLQRLYESRRALERREQDANTIAEVQWWLSTNPLPTDGQELANQIEGVKIYMARCSGQTARALLEERLRRLYDLRSEQTLAAQKQEQDEEVGRVRAWLAEHNIPETDKELLSQLDELTEMGRAVCSATAQELLAGRIRYIYESRRALERREQDANIIAEVQWWLSANPLPTDGQELANQIEGVKDYMARCSGQTARALLEERLRRLYDLRSEQTLAAQKQEQDEEVGRVRAWLAEHNIPETDKELLAQLNELTEIGRSVCSTTAQELLAGRMRRVQTLIGALNELKDLGQYQRALLENGKAEAESAMDRLMSVKSGDQGGAITNDVLGWYETAVGQWNQIADMVADVELLAQRVAESVYDGNEEGEDVAWQEQLRQFVHWRVTCCQQMWTRVFSDIQKFLQSTEVRFALENPFLPVPLIDGMNPPTKPGLFSQKIDMCNRAMSAIEALQAIPLSEADNVTYVQLRDACRQLTDKLVELRKIAFSSALRAEMRLLAEVYPTDQAIEKDTKKQRENAKNTYKILRRLHVGPSDTVAGTDMALATMLTMIQAKLAESDWLWLQRNIYSEAFQRVQGADDPQADTVTIEHY